MKLPILIECEPYKAKITHKSCVDRWRSAQTIQDKGAPAGNKAIGNAAKNVALRLCRDCPVGAKRAKKS
jgi:hypothetical protein